jgi:phosphomannomutase
MEINPSIFKSYDIRGIYPDELNEEAVYKIGQAFIEYIKPKRVVVGRDMRLSSPVLFEAISRGITDKGVDVYNIGLVPTECLYFTVGHYGYDGGIMITASHNPKDYNGFKLVKKGVEIIRGREIGQIIEKTSFSKSEKTGKIEDINIWPDYLNHIFSFVDINKIKPFKLVVDAGNGMAGKVIPLMEDKLPVEIIPLNFELDGNFPAHPPNPLLEGVIDQINETVKKEKADFGFIFDGDADRIFLIDEKGNFVRADITLLLLAKYFLEKNPSSAIIYNVICSKAVPEFIKKWGGRPIRTPVGFVNIKEGMLQNSGIMGGELSAHYSFRDNFYSDSGFITFLILLQIISQSGQKVSEITATLSPYAKSDEINFEIEDKQAILDKIKEKYSDAKQDYLDGVTIEYDDWWFNARPSQTEPLLRLTIEAKTKELLEKKKKELISLIK